MADLLGSILGAMEKPPVVNSEEAKAMKEQKKKLEVQQQKEKEQITAFRQKMQKQVESFMMTVEHRKLTFPAMSKVYRAVLHDIAEVAGLCSYSFGQEEVDRHIVMWKKEHTPSDAELSALKRGEEYDPQQAEVQERLQSPDHAQPSDTAADSSKKPVRSYTDRYHAIIKQQKEASKRQAVSGTHCYGMVPSANKLDQRTIEQVLAESQAKKRRKLENQSKEASSREQTEVTARSTDGNESKT